MDKFVANILVIFNKLETESITLFNNKIRDKQYISYYLYRIWIKYRDLIENTIEDKKEIFEVLKLLGIPKKYQDVKLIYPMINKMPGDENNLNKIIEIICKHFNFIHKQYIKNPNYGGSNTLYKTLNNLLISKDLKTIVEDIIQIRLLVPNLSIPESRQKIWERVEPLLKDLNKSL